MKISTAEREMLWNNNGPYSEAKIVINSRILDNKVSRIMIEVEGSINPTTFKIVEKNKEKFVNDPLIMQILATATYRGKEFGYQISAGAEEYQNEKSLQIAKEKLSYMKEAIIRMHEFVMEYLDL